MKNIIKDFTHLRCPCCNIALHKIQCIQYDYSCEDLITSLFMTQCPNTKKQIVIQELFGKYISWEYEEYQNSFDIQKFKDVKEIYYCYHPDKNMFDKKINELNNLKNDLKNIGFIFDNANISDANISNIHNINIKTVFDEIYFQTNIGTQNPSILAELNILNILDYNPNIKLYSFFKTWNNQFELI